MEGRGRFSSLIRKTTSVVPGSRRLDGVRVLGHPPLRLSRPFLSPSTLFVTVSFLSLSVSDTHGSWVEGYGPGSLPSVQTSKRGVL